MQLPSTEFIRIAVFASTCARVMIPCVRSEVYRLGYVVAVRTQAIPEAPRKGDRAVFAPWACEPAVDGVVVGSLDHR